MRSRTISFTLNDRPVTAEVKPHQNIVEMLQTQFALFGARESCGQGLCGCCTVLIDGKPVSGCLTLAIFLDGMKLITIEGLAESGGLDPVQQAFIDCGAFQCGYCTPGFVLMTKALLSQNSDPSDAEIRDWLSGNLCRCGAYPEILSAVKTAARAIKRVATG